MPLCKKCGAPFPNRVVVDGKSRCLNRRKYCLECSPFGQHNTKCFVGPDGRRGGDGEKSSVPCSRCGKDVEACRGGRSICQSCKVTANRTVHKLMAIKMLGGRCVRCGWSGHPGGFSFHHNSKDKESGLSQMFGSKSWDRIKSELEKCSLVCIRCHGIMHSSRFSLEAVSDAVWGRDLSDLFLGWLSEDEVASLTSSGGSSTARAPDCGSGGCGFESHPSPHSHPGPPRATRDP